MAYIPGPFQHDLFVSYSHQDVTWVNAFQEQLTEHLRDRLGVDCSIWQDRNELRTGQNWPDELSKAIRMSGAFIAVISRNYPSGWCEKELDAFLSEAESQNALEFCGYGRVLKVIKFPWLNDDHTGFLSNYQHVPFFDRDPKTGQEREFRHTSEPFHKAVKTLSFHIEKLFQSMLLGTEKVFVARTTDDLTSERDSIIREIKAAGYALSPPPIGTIAKRLNRETLLKYIAETRVSVHMLGAANDPDTRLQIDLALEANRTLIFCLMRGHDAATGDQKKLIEEVRDNKWNIRDGAWSLLEGNSHAAILKDLLGLLAPRKPMLTRSSDDIARIYLLCDPNSPSDASFARKIQGEIQAKEHFLVELPQVSTDSASPATRHERLLKECDGLLLYFDKASSNWYKRNIVDLLTAEDRIGRRELKSKALLVGGTNVLPPGLTVIQRQDPFDLSQLESFLAALRPLSTWQRGAAHAGN